MGGDTIAGMRPSRRPSLLLAALCAVVMLMPPAAAARADGGAPALSDDSRLGAEVTRLSEVAAEVDRRYGQVRRESAARKAEARRIGKLLKRQRKQITALHGPAPRTRHREGGTMPHTAQVLFTEDPDGLMHEHHAAWQTDLARNNAVSRNRRAEARLAADRTRATARWRRTERRSRRLAEWRRTVTERLESTQWTLQGRAEAAVAAGSCRDAIRLRQPARTARGWVSPVSRYRLSSGYGRGGARWSRRHTGQDFAVPIGTPVRAVGAGRVVRVSCGGPYGVAIVIRHRGGHWTQYAHLATVTVGRGDRVVPGQWIGQSGTTGNSTGPHLHFEVRQTPRTGSAVNPVRWLRKRGVHL